VTPTESYGDILLATLEVPVRAENGFSDGPTVDQARTLRRRLDHRDLPLLLRSMPVIRNYMYHTPENVRSRCRAG